MGLEVRQWSGFDLKCQNAVGQNNLLKPFISMLIHFKVCERSVRHFVKFSQDFGCYAPPCTYGSSSLQLVDPPTPFYFRDYVQYLCYILHVLSQLGYLIGIMLPRSMYVIATDLYVF